MKDSNHEKTTKTRKGKKSMANRPPGSPDLDGVPWYFWTIEDGVDPSLAHPGDKSAVKFERVGGRVLCSVEVPDGQNWGIFIRTADPSDTWPSRVFSDYLQDIPGDKQLAAYSAPLMRNPPRPEPSVARIFMAKRLR